MLFKRNKTIFILLIFALLYVTVLGSGSFATSLRPEGVPADYPNKEIVFINAFGPGSIYDAYVRILFQKAKEMEGWDYGVLVKYREGAGGRIGWSALAKANPDGYITGFVPSAAFIPSVAEDVPFGFEQYSYIFNMMSDPGAIGVAINSPYKTLNDIIAAAKENPGKISFGVTSVIGQEGLTLKLIQRAADVKFNIITFDAEAEAMSAVVGKHVDAFCLNVGDTTSFVEAGQIKIIATGAEKRSVFMPDVPTYRESGYDVIQVNMRSISGPAGMNEPIRQYLENCFMAAAEDPEVKEKAAQLKIPLESLRGADLKAKFGVIVNSLETLWESDPWN